MTPYPLRSNGKWLRVRYGAIMTPYQMICGSPFKMVVNLDFWHLWVFFLLVLKKFRGWQNPSKKVKVRLLSDFFWKIKLYQLCHFPFCSNWSLSLFNFHESFSITGDTIRNGLEESVNLFFCTKCGKKFTTRRQFHAHINRLNKQVVCFKRNLTVGSYVALRMHKKKCDQRV